MYYSAMATNHRYTRLPLDDLQPENPVHGVAIEGQAEAMRELRELHNSIGSSYRARDERMMALALSDSLSRQDMAVAVGLNKSRIDQILRELALADQHLKNVAAAERVGRHMPKS